MQWIPLFNDPNLKECFFLTSSNLKLFLTGIQTTGNFNYIKQTFMNLDSWILPAASNKLLRISFFPPMMWLELQAFPWAFLIVWTTLKLGSKNITCCQSLYVQYMGNHYRPGISYFSWNRNKPTSIIATQWSTDHWEQNTAVSSSGLMKHCSWWLGSL